MNGYVYIKVIDLQNLIQDIINLPEFKSLTVDETKLIKGFQQKITQQKSIFRITEIKELIKESFPIYKTDKLIQHFINLLNRELTIGLDLK